jgi:hypothetical protein
MTNTSTLINRFSRIFITALLFFPLTLFCQEVPSADKKDGWAIQVGAGYLYSGNVGVLAERQILLKNSFRVSPFASTGFAEGGESAQLKKYYWYGNSAGVNMEYGNKHRMVFGPAFVLQNLIGNAVDAKKTLLTSYSLILGYKGTADFGLIWQVYIGNIYSQDDDPFSINLDYSHRSQVGLGLGYKF